MTRNYFERSALAPYLQAPSSADRVGPGVEDEKSTHSPGGEADVAAGSMLQRVSSFSLLGGGGSAARSSAKKTPQRTLQTPPPTTPKETAKDTEDTTITPTWRLKDRMRTVGVGLVMALNVGTDPPDVIKPHPCAKLQCWIDPSKFSRQKAKEKIGEQLEAQYSNWQQQRARPLKYKRALDPTVDDVRALCLWLRRNARTERILLHYNGHGVPRPTPNGEVWVFDRNHTQYIPLSVTDLKQWMGKPSIVVLDCSCASVLMPFLTAPVDGGPSDEPPSPAPPKEISVADGSTLFPWNRNDMDSAAAQWVSDTIVLCPTSEQEWLPMHPDFPADIFSSCLTTPIQIALRWFVRRNPQSMNGLSPEAVDAIPGKANDRKTPLGELNWIFTAVTDSIAWNVLPKPLFSRLFRQDLLVASMFRNFLLADRILRSLNCTPQSYPPLPPGVCDHPLWQAWDLACETCLHGLIRDGILGNHVLTPNITADETQSSPNSSPRLVPSGPPPEQRASNRTVSTTATLSNVSSPFFSEQLTAFEVWLEFATIHKSSLGRTNVGAMEPYESPEQLPVVLQVLLSQVHRTRALELLRRFLELGPWAVNLALSLGVFPYVMKLLQSPEYKHVLVLIWAKILAFDQSCQADLVKDGSLPHFIHHLSWGLSEATAQMARSYNDAAEQRTMAAFILSVTCLGYPRGQTECLRQNLHGTCCALLSSADFGESGILDADGSSMRTITETQYPPPFRLWLCICLGNLVKDNNVAQTEAYGSGVHLSLFSRLNDDSPDVRAAACYSLGCLLGSSTRSQSTDGDDVGPRQPSPVSVARMGQPRGVLRVSGSPMQHPLVVPGLSAAGQPISVPAAGHLRPTFAPANVAGAPSLHWHAQPMPPQLAVQPTAYGQSMMPSHSSPRIRPQGGYSYLGQAQPALLSPQYNPIPDETHQQALSVFEDLNRLELDLSVMECLVQASDDASPLVRYEAVMSLACGVGKYTAAFTAVAEGLASSPGQTTRKSPQKDEPENDETSRPSSGIQLPQGVDQVAADKFTSVWTALRLLQRSDPHPAVSAQANTVVSVVHEHILSLKMELPSVRDEPDRPTIGGEETENLATGSAISRNKSDLGLSMNPPPASDKMASPAASSKNDVYDASGRTVRDRSTQSADTNTQAPLRRISSEYMSTWRQGIDTTSPSQTGRHEVEGASSTKQARFKAQYVLPTSKFYRWKKEAFTQTDDENAVEVDPLSPKGALHAYRERRNAQMHDLSNGLAARYASLAPKPVKPTRRSFDADLMFDDDAANAAEEEAACKRRELKLRQSALLTSDEISSILRFHPYEDALVVGDDAGGLSVWNVKNSTRKTTFRNGNPKNSRMTSALWINEMSESLFLVGSDDGSIRIWGGLINGDGEMSMECPSLSSSFFAAPDLVAGARGSGLITEWNQFSGKLIAGGNSKLIRCWDLDAQQCVTTLETNSEACVTTLTTACEYNPYGAELTPEGYHGFGPDIVVAGCSDGCLKVFDIRAKSQAAELSSISGSPRSRMRRRERVTSYSEHNSWIVNTSFTCFGGRPEIVSGSFAGDIKVWDLRMSSSRRTLEVQRSPMTALSTHSKIPMVATGSNTQFIKTVTLDGDTLQVIRYHEKKPGHRIGPVCCLEFHPHKLLLASGTNDMTVSIYSPSKPVQF